MAGDPETANDLVQETFVRVMTRSVPDDPAAAEPWMVRILVNLCRDLINAPTSDMLPHHLEAAARKLAGRFDAGY